MRKALSLLDLAQLGASHDLGSHVYWALVQNVKIVKRFSQRDEVSTRTPFQRGGKTIQHLMVEQSMGTMAIYVILYLFSGVPDVARFQALRLIETYLRLRFFAFILTLSL